jgi:hypothetical protein
LTLKASESDRAKGANAFLTGREGGSKWLFLYIECNHSRQQHRIVLADGKSSWLDIIAVRYGFLVLAEPSMLIESASERCHEEPRTVDNEIVHLSLF